MKFYLSSYKIGDDVEKLKRMIPENRKTAYISNAMDAGSRVQAIIERAEEDIQDLQEVGLDVEHVDLRKYFGKPNELKEKMNEYGVIWVSGGNVFALRQAMALSGFDNLLPQMKDSDVLYGGYSAGVCVLSPSLKGLDIVDDATAKPYGEQYDTIWDGLGVIDFAFAPHYDSDHPESEDIQKEIQYCIDNNIPYKALRDGEVIILE